MVRADVLSFGHGRWFVAVLREGNSVLFLCDHRHNDWQVARLCGMKSMVRRIQVGERTVCA